jgi:hypothetical protein
MDREPIATSGARWPFWLAAGVTAVGLVVTGALVWVSAVLNTNNEHRLLGLRARDVGSVLTAALPTIETPLASAAALADATGGNAQKFERFVGPYVGTGAGHPFVSVSLWRVGGAQGRPVVVVGEAPALSGSTTRAPEFFAHAAAARSRLSVIGLLQPPRLRLGYGFVEPGTAGRFAAYGESALPASRYSAVQSNSSFADLGYALYLGASARPENLLITSAKRLPLGGGQVAEAIPFGDNFLKLIVTARVPLAGSLPQRLPWAIGIVGIVLTLGAAALTVRLIDRRRHAEQLASNLERVADENERLYAEQRGIAQTLQHALLPEALPQLPGLQTGARYEAGVEGVEIGGDWYDLIAVDDRRLLLVVGDVSGRGLRAAATMASLRYAIQAYALQGDPPPMILNKLSKLVNVRASGQLATVLCALVDVETREVTITSAGHLPPLMISGDQGEFVRSDVGLPIGVDQGATYTSATVAAPPRATLLAFTDGLIERRGESIDVGLRRLRDEATANHATLEELLTRVVSELRDGAEDDTAIAGIRWLS